MNTSLELLYDTIGQPVNWHAALEKYAASFDAGIGSAALGPDLESVIGGYTRLLQNPGSTSLMPEALDSAEPAFLGVGMPMSMVSAYCEHYWRIDELTRHIAAGMTQKSRGTLCDGQFNRSRQYQESAFYREFMQPVGFGGRVFGWEHNPLHGQRHFTLSMLKRNALAVFSQDELAQFQQAMPHLQRAAYLHVHTTLLQQKVLGLERVMDAFPVGMLFVDTRGRLRHANRRARALLDSAIHADLHGFLRAGLNQSNTPVPIRKVFQQALAGHCACASLPAQGAAPELTLLALSVRDLADVGLHLDAPGVAFLLVEREVNPAAAVAMATQAYRLSAAEAALLMHLIDGGTPPEFAESRGVKISTVRTQLSNLLAKTRTQRQQDLVGLVARLMLVVPR
ncbi:hypothetical protein Q9Q94_04700 [Uliginosibacterium sp. 31-16]|uniref:helix-turn-helix transcriptional regulator n=1 Tax=Uliginosibacterium sp. 31-16 TaxID=3068315 RepID=UPI00273F5E21|nr:hypothetical protein [Uliginosibacterium sp. 31-16]MDP5238814.1 hypothetical protein [Uliginosibacterium sp. 31-16]